MFGGEGVSIRTELGAVPLGLQGLGKGLERIRKLDRTGKEKKNGVVSLVHQPSQPPSSPQQIKGQA